METTLVSVIVPVYNNEKYLAKCIESILHQSLYNLELILIDDGSIDNSLKICKEYEIKDRRIKVVSKKNGGAAEARNLGLEIATGKFVGFVDSDDWIDHSMYEIMYNKIIESNSEICLCGFTLEKDGIQKKLPIAIKEEYVEKSRIQEKILPRFVGPKSLNRFQNDEIEISAVRGLYKKELLDRNNIRFISKGKALAEDLLFNVEMLFFCEKLCVCDECFYHYYRHEGSVQRIYDEKYWSKLSLSCTETKKFINDNNLGSDISNRLDNRIFDFALRAISRIINSKITNHKKNTLIIELVNDEILINSLINFKYLKKKTTNYVGVRKYLLVLSIENKNILYLRLYFKVISPIIDLIQNLIVRLSLNY